MSEITPVAQRPRTISLNTARDQLQLSINALKRAIQTDTAEQLPDDIRRVPGGRVEGASYYIIARPYERVVGPVDEQPFTSIRKRKAS
jgi:hypothetical protein